MFFLLFLLDVRRIRIRIRISDQLIRIREAQKHTDPDPNSDPDRQHWLRQGGVGRCLQDPPPRPQDDGADLRLVKTPEPVILRAVVLALRLRLRLLLLLVRHRHLVLGLRQDEAHPLQPFRGSVQRNLQLFIPCFGSEVAFFKVMGLPHETDRMNFFTLILIQNFINCLTRYVLLTVPVLILSPEVSCLQGFRLP